MECLSLTLECGCAQIEVVLTRAAKTSALPGPQAYGVVPTLTQVSISVPNQNPNAICRSYYFAATPDTVTDGQCTLPASVTTDAQTDINNSSFDPDDAEKDDVTVTYVSALLVMLPSQGTT